MKSMNLDPPNGVKWMFDLTTRGTFLVIVWGGLFALAAIRGYPIPLFLVSLVLSVVGIQTMHFIWKRTRTLPRSHEKIPLDAITQSFIDGEISVAEFEDRIDHVLSRQGTKKDYVPREFQELEAKVRKREDIERIMRDRRNRIPTPNLRDELRRAMSTWQGMQLMEDDTGKDDDER